MPDSAHDLATCSVSELIDRFTAISQEIESVDHIGRVNRLHETRRRVVAAIKDRTDGTARALLPLADHEDPHVRRDAAFFCGELDPEVYMRVLRELALRSDKIGRDAATSLEWQKEHPFTGPVTLAKEPPSPYASRLSGHKPPAGMSLAELESLLFDAFPRDMAKSLLALARPSIRAWPQPFDESTPIAASRLGGMPAVSNKWAWPTTPVSPKWGGLDWLNKPTHEQHPLSQEPQWFLGQINCADIAGFAAGRSLVPRDGIFLFFADSDLVTGCTPSNEAALYYFSSATDLEIAAAPIEDFEVLPACSLGFAEAIDLPDPFSAAIESLALDKPLRDRYFDIRSQVSRHGIAAERYDSIDHSKLFGWPDLVQNELEAFSGKSGGDACLLLQLGNYDNTRERWSWGPGGLVYFVYSEADLCRGNLRKGQCEMQCT